MIFDLNKSHDFITSNLQNNLKLLYKIYSSHFTIKFNDILIDVTLKLEKSKINKIQYYSLIYDINNRNFSLYPFKIIFIDFTTNKLNNNSYVSNIHKTNNISGSDMVKLVLQINKILNVKKVYLHDETTVECYGISYDLSYIKLLESNTTFYMKLGFNLEISNTDHLKLQFPNKKEKNKYILETIKKCKKIKNKTIIDLYSELLNILTTSIINNDYDKIKKYIFNYYDESNTYLGRLNIIELINESKEIIDLLHINNETYLYETMIKLFNNKNLCLDYDLINKYFIYNPTYKIIYKNKKIDFSIFNDFKLLNKLRYSMYSYEF